MSCQSIPLSFGRNGEHSLNPAPLPAPIRVPRRHLAHAEVHRGAREFGSLNRARADRRVCSRWWREASPVAAAGLPAVTLESSHTSAGIAPPLL